MLVCVVNDIVPVDPAEPKVTFVLPDSIVALDILYELAVTVPVKVAFPVSRAIVNRVVSTFVPTPILNKLLAPSYLIDAPLAGLAVVPSCNKIF